MHVQNVLHPAGPDNFSDGVKIVNASASSGFPAVQVIFRQQMFAVGRWLGRLCAENFSAQVFYPAVDVDCLLTRQIGHANVFCNYDASVDRMLGEVFVRDYKRIISFGPQLVYLKLFFHVFRVGCVPRTHCFALTHRVYCVCNVTNTQNNFPRRVFGQVGRASVKLDASRGRLGDAPKFGRFIKPGGNVLVPRFEYEEHCVV